MTEPNKKCEEIKEELRFLRKTLKNLSSKIDYLENELKLFVSPKEAKEIKKENFIKCRICGHLNSPELEICENLACRNRLKPKAKPKPSPELIPKTTLPKIKVELEKKITEEKLGKYWLNKIGIAILVLGVAFFIQYTFKYLGAFAKISIGYLLGATFLIGGNFLERKDLYKYYARALIGGAWAIIYFTTYAMHHFPATRLIDNQLLDLLLLSIVSGAMIMRSLRYKLPGIVALAYFIGYLTASLSNISIFTFLYCVILAISLAIIVYKFKWYKLLFFGIIFTYMTHILWIYKRIYLTPIVTKTITVPQAQFWLNFAFLSLYWLTFCLPLLLIKKNDIAKKQDLALASGLFNFVFYFFLSLSQIYKVLPAYKFHFIFGLGLLYLGFSYINRINGANKISLGNVFLGLALLTASVPFKTTEYNTTLIWTIELPVIILIGFLSNKISIRLFGFLIAGTLLFKLFGYDLDIGAAYTLGRFSIPWNNLILFAGFISFSFAYGIYKYYKKELFLNERHLLSSIYALISCLYLTIFIMKVFPEKWLTLIFAIEALVLFLVGYLLKEGAFRFVSFVILLPVFFRVLFNVDRKFFVKPVALFMHLGEIIVFYIIYFLQRTFANKYKLEDLTSKSLVCLGAVGLIFILWGDLSLAYVTLSWGLLAFFTFFIAILMQDKFLRFVAVLLFIPLFLRIVFFEETFFSDIIQLIIYLIVIGLFFAVYALYSIFVVVPEKKEDYTPKLFMISGTFLLSFILWREISYRWVTLSWGIEGVILFLLGFLTKDKIFRYGGFVVFALVLLRVFIVDLAEIETIYRIISFVALGVLFLLISFAYTKYSLTKK